MLSIIQNFLICKTLPFLKFADTTFYLVYNTCEFWKKALEERKNKGINQEVLAQQPGTNVPANGRYERDEKKLSIDAA
ncbi:MAG: hypothetical protein LH478_03015 [Chitinophagaceae bacterium]|nr:hypothetical protein [Chitinophagaceae bacterium]